jgi:hypothetical protein
MKYVSPYYIGNNVRDFINFLPYEYYTLDTCHKNLIMSYSLLSTFMFFTDKKPIKI